MATRMSDARRTLNQSVRIERRSATLLAAPAVLLLTVFTVVPILFALTLGFTNAQLLSPQAPQFVGLTNFSRLLGVGEVTLHAQRDPQGHIVTAPNGDVVYERLNTYTSINSKYPNLRGKEEWFRFGENRQAGTVNVVVAGDPLFWQSLRNTLFFALVVVPVQGGLGLLLALLVNERIRGRNFFRTIYFIPTLTSMVVISMLWGFMYQPSGMFNKVLQHVIPGFQPIDWLNDTRTAMPAIIVLSIWQAVGYHMIIWLGGLQTIPGEIYEAARVDGANKWHEIRYVTLPGLRHTFVFVLITITIAALGLFTQINVLTQGGPLGTTSTLVYQSVLHGYQRQEIGYGSAISFVFFFMVLGIALFQRFITRRIDQ